MADIRELRYRPMDQLIDSVRLDMMSFQSAGDIDTSFLIKKVQQINYELGIRIRMQKETMLEVDNHRAKLPADFHQSLLTLICHNYRHISTAPWNGNVLLEQPPVSVPPSNCPCWTITYTGNVQTTYTDCNNVRQNLVLTGQTSGTTWIPVTTTLCAAEIDNPGNMTVSTNSFCFPGVNGTFSCTPPCDICNITHDGDCPEIVNPYPLGKCRTICNDSINIKILQYCSADIRCYEQFERLYIEPHTTPTAFNQENRYITARNYGSISNGFLYVPGIECTKVYLWYLGDLEDEEGNLLVLDHPLINSYYSWSLKLSLLENLWMNGEDLLQKVKYAHEQVESYRQRAHSIANMPDFRQCIGTIQTLKRNWNRQFYHPLSRYWGNQGFAINSIPVDVM